MSTPQDAPVGKHHAPETPQARNGRTACRWSAWSTPGNATAR